MAVTVNAAIIDEKDTVVVAIEKINAACDIHVGEHVHVHNVQNHRENL